MPWLEPMRGQMTRAAVWHISSKEPNLMAMGGEGESGQESVWRAVLSADVYRMGMRG